MPNNPMPNGTYSARPQQRAAKREGKFFSVSRLPDAQYDALWEKIFVEDLLKKRLLRFLEVLLALARHDVPTTALALRRAILLYGAPGTGKSSLACGLAQQLAKQRGHANLIKINAHGIPSGERGGTQKNVLHLFEQLTEVACVGQPTFAVVDEVESLATNRAAVNPETNPLDTLYAVNAFIEGLDCFVNRHPNVVFVFTSNMTAAIDRAMLERTDFQQEIPLPDENTRLRILTDAVNAVGGIGGADNARSEKNNWNRIVKKSAGLSGRTLRHLIVQALTFTEGREKLRLDHLLQATEFVAKQQKRNHETGGFFNHGI